MLLYNAVLVDWDHPDTDLGPINLDDAIDDRSAQYLAIDRAKTLMDELGLRRALLKISKRGHGMPIIDLNGN